SVAKLASFNLRELDLVSIPVWHYRWSMDAAIIAFDDYTDIDVFLLWDLLNRVREPGCRVRILGDSEKHTSSTGIELRMHGHISEANACDVVLFTSGIGTRRKRVDAAFLAE